jgi:signal transduction histidine kinase
MSEAAAPARSPLRSLIGSLLLAAIALVSLIAGARAMESPSAPGAIRIERMYSDDPRVHAYDRSSGRPLDPFRGYADSVLGPDTAPVTWHYTLRLARRPTQPWALLQPGAISYSRLAVNGTSLSDPSMGGLLRAYLPHLPTLTRIPANLLRAGDNRIEIELVAQEGSVGWARLPHPSIGPEASLFASYSALRFYKVTSLQAINICMLMIAALSAALWRLRPRETLYGQFSLGILGWLGFNLLYTLHFPPVSDFWLHFYTHAALAISLTALLLFMHRIVGAQRPLTERAAMAGSALAIGGLLVAYLGFDEPVAAWVRNWPFRAWLLLIGIYSASGLLIDAWRNGGQESRWLAACALVCIGVGINDSAAMLFIDQPHPKLLQYTVFFVALVFMAIILRRFVGALDRAEQLNLALDTKVREKTTELHRVFAERQRLERENLLAQERRRIMTDMHDGIGGQLVALLAGIRHGQHDVAVTASAIATALGDLRLMIDSLDDATGDVAVALGMFRARTDPRLREAGLATVWDTASIPDHTTLSPRRVLLLFRVLQEAIANVLKHAKARTLHVSARLDDAPSGGLIRISVRDDGVGLPRRLVPGRGIGSLTQRARQLGGSISWHDADPGTECRLEVPLSSSRD